MLIRLASVDDAEEILAIYAPYVLDTAITFDILYWCSVVYGSVIKTEFFTSTES